MLPPAGQPVYQHKTRIVIATLVVTLTSTYRTTTARVWTPRVELPTQTMPALGWREAAVLRPSRGDRKPSRRQAKTRLDRCDSVEAQLTPPLQATRGRARGEEIPVFLSHPPITTFCKQTLFCWPNSQLGERSTPCDSRQERSSAPELQNDPEGFGKEFAWLRFCVVVRGQNTRDTSDLFTSDLWESMIMRNKESSTPACTLSFTKKKHKKNKNKHKHKKTNQTNKITVY